MWSWEQKHEDSFVMLKDLLCSDQVLAFPAPVTEGRHYVVTTDFSYEGISAILSQWSDPDEREESEYYAPFIMRLAHFLNLRKTILLLRVRL